MIKVHKIKLYPNNSQEILFKKSCGVARFSFNWALNKWQELYYAGENPSAYTLIKLQNSIKKEQFPFFSEVSKNAPQYAIHNVEKAFKNYFRELKNGIIDIKKKKYISYRKSKGLNVNDEKLKNIGKPKFKKKNTKDSFIAIENNHQFKQKDFKIRLPRIGWMKCAENVRFDGKVNNVAIKKIADMWFAFINIEVTESIPALKQSMGDNQAIVGIDFGIKSMMVLSDGTIYENPKALKSNLKRLKRLQKSLFRKENGSKNRYKQRMKLARLHYRVSNIRENAIHQATSKIIESYDRIIIEDLNVEGLIKNRKLAQAIGDVSFWEIRRQLTYKSKWNGKELIIADRFYASSKTCSNCGHKKEELKLIERIYKCDNCGLKIDRDLNAAKNLANYGTTVEPTGSQVCGGRSSSLVTKKSFPMKQKIESFDIKNNYLTSKL